MLVAKNKFPSGDRNLKSRSKMAATGYQLLTGNEVGLVNQTKNKIRLAKRHEKIIIRLAQVQFRLNSPLEGPYPDLCTPLYFTNHRFDQFSAGNFSAVGEVIPHREMKVYFLGIYDTKIRRTVKGIDPLGGC